MAVDLMSLLMHFKTTGTAQVTADLKGVESQGVRTAASLGGLTGQLDRQTSAALNNTKGFKDLSGAYAMHATAANGAAASTAAAATATETLGSKLKSFALTAVEVAAVGVAFGGLVKFLFDSAKEAANAEQVQVRLRTSVRDTGLSWGQYGEALNGAAAALQRQTTFSDTDAKAALATLVTATHSAADAQRLLGTAADLAAFKHISLDAAAQILARTLAGNTRSMKEYGITTTDGAEAVAQLGLLLSGQAAAAADTFNGRLTQLHNSWNSFKEAIGGFVISSGLAKFLADSAREVNTLASAIEALNRKLGGGGSSNPLAGADTADLTNRLRELRGAASGQTFAGIGVSVAPLTGDALAKNQQEQIAIQNELVDREKARAFQAVLAANKQADADSAHITALAEGYKLGTLTHAENLERLTVVKQLREEMAGANLEERNHLQAVINSLTPKVESMEARLRALLAMMGGSFGVSAPARLDAGPLAGGNPSLKGPLNLPDVITAAPGGRGRGGQEDNAGFRAILQAGQSVKDQFATLGTNLGLTLANAFSSAVGAAAKGGNFFKTFGLAVLAGLGNIFMQMGQAMVMASPLFVALNNAMKNPFTSGFALLGIGIAMMALGAVLGGIASGGGGGGGHGGSSSAPKDQVTQIKLVADGAGGFQAPGSKGLPFQVLAINSPRGQHVLATAMDAGARRGL